MRYGPRSPFFRIYEHNRIEMQAGPSVMMMMMVAVVASVVGSGGAADNAKLVAID